MNRDLILSFEKYSKIKHKRPYFYSIESKDNDKILYYFGAEHQKDPNHHQFEFLQNKWEEFIHRNEVSKIKSVIFFEWNMPEDCPPTLEESIKKYGESGAIVFLANQSNIPHARPEPTIKYEVGELLKDFSREEIFYFYISRIIGSRKRMSMEQDIEKTIELGVERYRHLLLPLWQDFNFSSAFFKEIHFQLFDREFNKKDEDLFAEMTNPMLFKSKLNEIARRSSTIRNIFMLGQVEKYWQEGYSIFIVYGASHAVMQEDAIKSLAQVI